MHGDMLDSILYQHIQLSSIVPETCRSIPRHSEAVHKVTRPKVYVFLLFCHLSVVSCGQFAMSGDLTVLVLFKRFFSSTTTLVLIGMCIVQNSTAQH